MYIFVSGWVLGFELRSPCLLARRTYCLSYSASPKKFSLRSNAARHGGHTCNPSTGEAERTRTRV
jgi:hypothetical protein